MLEGDHFYFGLWLGLVDAKIVTFLLYNFSSLAKYELAFLQVSNSVNQVSITMNMFCSIFRRKLFLSSCNKTLNSKLLIKKCSY